MKNLISQNADIIGLNSISLAISLSNVEQIMQIAVLTLTLIYTTDRYIQWRKSKKND